MLTINRTTSLKLISLKKVLSFSNQVTKTHDQASASKMCLSLHSGMIQFVIYQHTFLSFLFFSHHLLLIFQEKHEFLSQRNRKHLLRWEMWPRRIHGEAGGALYDFKGVNKWPQWNESMEICATVLIHVFVFQCVQRLHVMKMPSFKLPFR